MVGTCSGKCSAPDIYNIKVRKSQVGYRKLGYRWCINCSIAIHNDSIYKKIYCPCCKRRTRARGQKS